MFLYYAKWRLWKRTRTISDFLCIVCKEMTVPMNIIKKCTFPPDYFFSSFQSPLLSFCPSTSLPSTLVWNTPLWSGSFKVTRRPAMCAIHGVTRPAGAGQALLPGSLSRQLLGLRLLCFLLYGVRLTIPAWFMSQCPWEITNVKMLCRWWHSIQI